MNDSDSSPEPHAISIEIVLTDGHRHNTELMSDSPLIETLFAALTLNARPSSERVHQLLQIPLDQGRSALSFSSQHLVSLTTRPPVLIDVVDSDAVMEAKFVQIDDLLSRDELANLLHFTLAQEANMQPGTVVDNAPDRRKSRVLFPRSEPCVDIVGNRVLQKLPEILSRLGHEVFATADVEVNLTAHNDGDFFKLHRDNASEDTMQREITFVYYFYRDPDRVRGGALRLYDSKLGSDGSYINAHSFHTVEPRQNSVVVFPSHCLHEVLPVSCPSKAFADSRFTVNGWIHRRDSR